MQRQHRARTPGLKRKGVEVSDRTPELEAALEREAATRDILRVINRSPGDYQPAFDAILEHAAHLCDASLGLLLIREQDGLHCVAHRGGSPESIAYYEANPLPLDPEQSVSARTAMERRPIQVPDAANDPIHAAGQPHRRIGVEKDRVRTQLTVPMLRGDECIGVILVYRQEVRLFDDAHVELLTDFAEMAVLAIDNVSRFRALSDSLERQTATSEVLRVISRSPTDYAPVFQTILENAIRLCKAPFGTLFMLRGSHLHMVADVGSQPEMVEYLRANPIALDEDSAATSRAVRKRAPSQIADLKDEAYRSGDPRRIVAVDRFGVRTWLAVPILKNDEVVGVIALYRQEVKPFADDDIELVRTFADQAVIAIENVRSFKEIQARTADLTRTLERQTATGEILRTISRSPTDYGPVFDAILDNATRLCDAPLAFLLMREGDEFHFVAHRGSRPEFVEFIRANPVPLHSQGTLAGLAAREGVPQQLADITDSDSYRSGTSIHRVASADMEGIRTGLFVPMMKSEACVGIIALYRREVRAFEEGHLALVSTFADQAVIAIDNVRLFQQLEQRNAELHETLERQTATSEILRSISQSPTDYRPVFDTILESATRLCDAPLAQLYVIKDGGIHAVASRGTRKEFRDFERDHVRPVDRAVGAIGRALAERRPVHAHDVADEDLYRDGDKYRVAAVELEGVRTGVCVPMLKGDEAIGVIMLYRRDVRPFEERQVSLVETFADQAVIALENVRLFQTVESRSSALAQSVAELEALGEVAQAVSSSLDVQTVLNTIIERAVQLSGAHAGAINELDEATGTLPPRAAPGVEEMMELPAPRLGEGALGRAAATHTPVQIPDITVPGAYTGRLLDTLSRHRIRALLAVPMVQDDKIVGTLAVARRMPGEFPPETVRLLHALATQSAIAIRNARLFREIEEQSRELEAANRHKSEFLANMSHELRTPLNAVIGFSEVLGENMFGELNDKQAEYVKDIHDSGRHLLSLINDILDLSKIEAGAMELDVGRFALRPALDNALTLVKERAGRRGIGLEAEMVGELGEMDGDERKLKQILLNLLSNAIKFTGEGGTVTLEAARDADSVHIAVRDTGVGISTEDQALIFDEFRQVGTDYARKVEGTGLGLTLTKRFVEMHGGRITVESEPEVGSVFRVTLPLQPAEVQP
jgi:GAF domain-containing protein/anti-sigma regulatory factor (Ser/Thr protein kinase)